MNITREENTSRQLLIGVSLGLPAPLMVVCRSASREDTSFEIFDQNRESMGVQRYRYANGSNLFHRRMVDELNVLLEEWGARIELDDFYHISSLAVSKCENCYGNGVDGGDCVITIQ